MNKKNVNIFIILAILMGILVAVYFSLIYLKLLPKNKINTTDEKNVTTPIATEDNAKDPTDNSKVIAINKDTSIRVINYYDKDMFKGKKSLIIMFGTWCHNCSEELIGLADIVNYYKNTDINVVLVAHEYEQQTLIDFLNNSDVKYNTQVYLDLGRVIRKGIDPEASTVPVNYFLDEDGNIKYKLDTTISLDTTKDLINKYLK